MGCSAAQDKNRRQKLAERRDTPVEMKLCSRCTTNKHTSEFYRDASKLLGKLSHSVLMHELSQPLARGCHAAANI